MKLLKFVAGLPVVLLLLLLAPAAGAQSPEANYPNRPIRIVVPYAPGGTTDILARLLGAHMTIAWGHQVVVDNRSGGGGIIGSEILAKASPDGYTLFVTPSGSHTANPSLYRKLPYDTVRDFAAISLIAWVTNMIVTHPSSPINTLQDLINHARANPGKLTYASSGNGTVAHLSAEMLKSIAKINMVHVPYKGGGPALAAIAANEITVMFAALPSATPFVQSKRIKPLAVTSPNRAASLPDVPTVREAGVPGIAVREWYGIFAPGGTPAGILRKTQAEVVRIIRIPEVEKRMNELGAEPVGSDPKALADQVAADIKMWAPIVKAAGARAD
ncbi:MAG: tripartite tricarboxylate transporter substrate binding protein [Burkholderiales bacterium]|nr:tripartite tricarboxylate transporter substrate binding protein [Burkholderiales bacterium]